MNQENRLYSYDPFARQRFYTLINRRLLEQVSLHSGQTVVDLGCGTGAITKLLLSMAHGLVVIAVDRSAEMLEEAKTNLADLARGVMFVRAGAEELSSHLPTKVDAVVFCNSIHMITDKAKVISEVSKALGLGGLFAFNSAFFDGAVPASSLPFYKKVMLKTIRILRNEYGITHQRGERTEARQLLTPEGYEELLSVHDFRIRHQKVVEVQMPFDAVQAIAAFDYFITGALPGVPLSAGSSALKTAVSEAFDDLRMPSLPRNWLQVVAERC